MPLTAFLAKVRKALCLGPQSSDPAAAAPSPSVPHKPATVDAMYLLEGVPAAATSPPTQPTPPHPFHDPNFQPAASPAQPPPLCSCPEVKAEVKAIHRDYQGLDSAGARMKLAPTTPLKLPSWQALRRGYSSAPLPGPALRHARVRLPRRALSSKGFAKLQDSRPGACPLPPQAFRSSSLPSEARRLDAQCAGAATPLKTLTSRPSAYPRSSSSSVATGRAPAARISGRTPSGATWSQPSQPRHSGSTRPSGSPSSPQLSLLDLRAALQLRSLSPRTSGPAKSRSGLESLGRILQSYSGGGGVPGTGAAPSAATLNRYSSLGQRQSAMRPGAQDVFLNALP